MTTNVSRRSVAKGALWATPAVAVAASAPALAASAATVTIGSTVCNIFNGTSTANAQTEKVYWSFTAVDSTGASTNIPAGTVITQQVCVDPSSSSNSGANWNIPMNTYPGSASGPTDTSGPWYISLTTTSGAPLASNTTETGAMCFNVNFHFNQATDPASLGCLNGILWDSSTSNLALIPASTMTITSNSSVTGTGTATAGSGSLVYQVTQRTPSSVNTPGRIPTNFKSKSGTQTCFPSVSSSQGLQSDGADDVVCYPSGTNITTARCNWGTTFCTASTAGLCTPPYKSGVSGQTNIPSMC